MNTRHHPILNYLRQALGTHGAGGVSDADLLRRFVDERDDSVDDGYFAIEENKTDIANIPGFFHNNRGVLSFADGHAELHKWVDANTTVPVHGPAGAGCAATGLLSPRDGVWIDIRSSAPK